jgi:hypothetical protein
MIVRHLGVLIIWHVIMKMTRGSIVQFHRLASIADLTTTTTKTTIPVTVVMVITFAVAIAVDVTVGVTLGVTVGVTVGTVNSASSIIRRTIEGGIVSELNRRLIRTSIATTSTSGHPRCWTAWDVPNTGAVVFGLGFIAGDGDLRLNW